MGRVRSTDLLLLGAVLLWSFNFTVTKYALTHGFRPLSYSLLRYLSAAVIFSAYTVGREGRIVVRRRDVALLLLAACFGVWMNQLCYVYALRFTTATTVALLLGTTPVWVALVAAGSRVEGLSARILAAAAVSFGGVALVALGERGAGVSSDVKGDLLALGTAATWSVYSVALAPLMRRYSPHKISAVVLGVGGLPLLATGGSQLVAQDWSHLGGLVWAGAIYATLGPLVVTNMLWYTAIDRVGPSRASLFANIQPFLAAVFAVLLLSESMTGLQIAGGVAIAIGIVLARVQRAPVAAPVE